MDGNGKLSARELCLQGLGNCWQFSNRFKLPQISISGGLSAKEAQRLLRIWDQARWVANFSLLVLRLFPACFWNLCLVSVFQDTDGELTQMELGGVVQLG